MLNLCRMANNASSVPSLCHTRSVACEPAKIQAESPVLLTRRSLSQQAGSEEDNSKSDRICLTKRPPSLAEGDLQAGCSNEKGPQYINIEDPEFRRGSTPKASRQSEEKSLLKCVFSLEQQGTSNSSLLNEPSCFSPSDICQDRSEIPANTDERGNKPGKLHNNAAISISKSEETKVQPRFQDRGCSARGESQEERCQLLTSKKSQINSLHDIGTCSARYQPLKSRNEYSVRRAYLRELPGLQANFTEFHQTHEQAQIRDQHLHCTLRNPTPGLKTASKACNNTERRFAQPLLHQVAYWLVMLAGASLMKEQTCEHVQLAYEISEGRSVQCIATWQLVLIFSFCKPLHCKKGSMNQIPGHK